MNGKGELGRGRCDVDGLHSLLVIYAENDCPGQLQKQSGLMVHQLTCPLLLLRVQVKGESLCTHPHLMLSTWQDTAVPHPASCRNKHYVRVLSLRLVLFMVL